MIMMLLGSFKMQYEKEHGIIFQHDPINLKSIDEDIYYNLS